MNNKTKVETMLRCNPKHLVEVVVEVLVRNHNEKPTIESQELLEEVARQAPEMVREAGPAQAA